MATTKSLLDSALAGARASREQDLEDLMALLRIPSVSTLPERRDDCLRAARWLSDRFERMGFKARIVEVRKEGLPVGDDFGNFWRDFEWMGVQRQLKVLGIFARLAYRDGKRAYIDDMPRVMAAFKPCDAAVDQWRIGPPQPMRDARKTVCMRMREAARQIGLLG